MVSRLPFPVFGGVSTFPRVSREGPVSGEEYWTSGTEGREFRCRSLLDDFSISVIFVRERPETGCVSTETLRHFAEDEQEIEGGLPARDPDFHRRDLFEAIERGDYPEWELGLQMVEEKDELKFDFDLLDPTKLIPEELVPVRRVGKMTLNRNPDNYFARPSKSPSTPATWCRGSTSPMTRCCRGACSPTSTPSIVASGRISPSCRSTGRPIPSIDGV
jgi:Catalase